MKHVILVADWSKHRRKRAVYKAYPAHLRVEFERPPQDGWTLERLLELARTEQETWHGAVLIALDVGLGVPQGFLERSPWPETKSFPEWLLLSSARPEFFLEVQDAQLWGPAQPFFRVLPGRGSYRRFSHNEQGIPVLREVDHRTGGKPLFLVSGIPGSVGSATREVWRELVNLLPREDRRFTLWPFESLDLQNLLADRRIIVAETYPRAAYATALRDLGDTSPQLVIHETRHLARQEALSQLEQMDWWKELGIGLDPGHRLLAADDEDCFDALLTTAALLRCAATGLPLFSQKYCDEIEGAILGTGTVDLEAPPEAFRYGDRSTS